MARSDTPRESDPQVEERVTVWVQWWLNRVNEVAATFGYCPIPMPGVLFDLAGTDAAQALVDDNAALIRLNQILLSQHADQYRDEIIPHELAHVAADRWLGEGRESHGYQWRWVMGQLGVVPRPHHDMISRSGVALSRPE